MGNICGGGKKPEDAGTVDPVPVSLPGLKKSLSEKEVGLTGHM